MIILSHDEYREAEHQLNTLIAKGDQNLSHEERMLYEELLDATLAWENGKLGDEDKKEMENMEKKYIRKGEVLYRHKHSREYLAKFKQKGK
jgi:hypothetical protein